MHTLAGLAGTNVTAWATHCAERIALITVIRPGCLADILSSRLLKRSSPNKTSKTKRAEEILELPDGVYFFAGRAHPSRAGDAAFFIAAENLSQHDGRATPFDTGGVAHEITRLPWDDGTSASRDAKKRRYVQSHSVQIEDFKTYFARHLSAFFESAPDYWASLPSRPIDGVAFGAVPDYDWLDWTFEVRYYSDLPVTGMDLYAMHDVAETVWDREAAGDGILPGRIVVVDNPGVEAEKAARIRATL